MVAADSLPKYQILTNCVDPNGNLETTQIEADKTVMSEDDQFIQFWKNGEQVASVNARHTVYVKRI